MSAARDDGPEPRGKDRYETERDTAMIFMGACTLLAGPVATTPDGAIKKAADMLAKAKSAAAFV